MEVGLSHQGTKTQRGTKACAATPGFVVLRVLVPWWHLVCFPARMQSENFLRKPIWSNPIYNRCQYVHGCDPPLTLNHPPARYVKSKLGKAFRGPSRNCIFNREHRSDGRGVTFFALCHPKPGVAETNWEAPVLPLYER